MKTWLRASLLSTALFASAYVAAAPMQAAQGIGAIKAIDAQATTVTLQHEAIPALNWPGMTMPFNLAKPALAKGLAVGQKVKFDVEMDSNHQISITAIHPVK
ncbi:MAG: copper-binding protein [Formivibrio sp.]|nr:copper-binding protein [Formivibrio sp.]